jgi:hypothetical protein
MNAAMLLNHDPATVICRDVRSVSQVIAGWTIWRMITKVAKAWDCIMPVGTRDGRADGCSNTVERSLHANRSWTCSNEERRLWLRLLEGYTYGRIEDAHYARNVEIKSRNKGSSDQTIACSTVDDFVRLTI